MASFISMKKYSAIFLILTIGPGLAVWGAGSGQAPQFSVDQILQLWNSNQKSQALRQIDRWKSQDKKSPEPWIAAANIAFEQKKYKRCLSMGEKALDKSSQAAAAYYWRGRAFEAMANWLDAGNEYRAALLADPNFPMAKESLDRIGLHLSVPVLETRGDKPADSKP